MTPEDVIRRLGGEGEGAETRAAKRLGVTRQYINILKKRGKIPPKTQAWIQVKTKGELLAEEEDENSNPLA